MPKWGKYKKSYRKEWESDQSLKTWITPVVGDDTKAFCKYCQSEIRAQLNDLKEHTNTKKHKSRCAPSIKTFTVSAGAAGQCPIKDDQKRREIRIAAYIACHSSINAVDDLSDILKDEMGTFQMHRTKCTAIIKSVLAPHFREELVEDIGESPYSLYLDESTDISVNKLLCICVKYHSKKHSKFVSTYLGLVELTDADAKAISDTVVAFLSKNGLQIKNMMGIATDGASVMVGKNHSVFTLLKQIQPNLQLIRCVCHSLDIVANKAMQLLPSNIEYMVRETYNWFAHSAKRQYEYKNIYETINNGGCPLKLISPSCTRWLVMADCINRIVDQKDALTLHFNMASSTEHCYTARLLKEMYNDKTNLLYMYFLQPVLMEIKAVNKCFQLETGNSLGVFRDLERLYMTTVRRILKPSVLRNHKQLRELDLTQSGIFLSPLDADLGTTFMDKLEESRLAPDMKERISSRCMDFLKELVKQYQLRLPASMEILSKLELFCPKSVISTINRPGVKDLPADLFSCPIGTLETQWRNVATANFSDDQDIDKFWLEVEAFKDAGGHKCFQELAQGAIRLLVLPVSNAHVERAFSLVSLLKDDTRNRMGLPLLSSIMDVRTGLVRNGFTSATFKPPRQLLERFDSTIY